MAGARCPSFRRSQENRRVAEGTESSENTAVTRDPYAVLGVSHTASLAEIREAYWRQVRFHSMGTEADLRLQELREAYETLTDPSRRAAYDSPGAGGEPVTAPVPTYPEP